MSQTSRPMLILFLLEKKNQNKTKEKNKQERVVQIYVSVWMIYKGGGIELELRYQKKTADNIVMCYHEKISPY